MKLIIILTLLATFTWSNSYAQQSQQEPLRCALRNPMVSMLENKYSETLTGLGRLKGDGRMELYTNRTTGTWTILMTVDYKGAVWSCILVSGPGWQSIDETTQGIEL